MSVTVNIETTTDAFAENTEQEAARLLEQIATKLRSGEIKCENTRLTLYDTNGKICGNVWLSPRYWDFS